MSTEYTIPLWFYIILLGLSGFAVMQLFVFPTLRRFIYNRASVTRKHLNRSLDVGLPQYAIAKRRLWVDRLLNDEQVQQAIQESASQQGSLDNAERTARTYAREIVPSFNTLLYFRAGYWLARKFLRAFYWIHIGQAAREKYSKIGKNSCVVLVSNHRSNFDPLLMIYLTSRVAPISYSAGEWALTTPFRQILQAMGFFVIRRDQSGNSLYRKILERYVYLATAHHVPQGVFIEGGLSRDGHMLPLRLGLISYISRALQSSRCEDIVFIPCGLNYDKIPEDKTLVIHREQGFKQKKPLYALISFAKFFISVLVYVVPRRFKPFGYSCVNFGDPISLTQWLDQHDVDLSQADKATQRKTIGTLGQQLADNIRQLIPILPSNLIARVLADYSQTPLTELELKLNAQKLADQLSENGVKVFIPGNDEDYAFSQGIYVLLRRKLIEPTGDGRFRLVPAQQQILEYYTNTIESVLKNTPKAPTV